MAEVAEDDQIPGWFFAEVVVAEVVNLERLTTLFGLGPAELAAVAGPFEFADTDEQPPR